MKKTKKNTLLRNFLNFVAVMLWLCALGCLTTYEMGGELGYCLLKCAGFIGMALILGIDV